MSVPPRCRYVLHQGGRNPQIEESAKYNICVTPTAHKHLFGDKTKLHRLGCGLFACAYQHKDPDKIVKLTIDRADAGAMLRARGVSRVAKLHEIFELAEPATVTSQGQGPTRDVFAMVVEKLRPLNSQERARWHKATRILPKRIPSLAVPVYLRRNLARACEIGAHTQQDRATCRHDVFELARTARDLERRDVAWIDRHAGNVGVDKHGQWKILDLGFRSAELDEDVPLLEGAYRRRKRRR